MIQIIKDIKDVELFFECLWSEGTNIHPDDDFQNVVNIETGATTYSTKEAQLRNSLMRKSFAVCVKEAVDIYDLGLTIFLKKSGLNKMIPLPVSA